MENKSTTVGNGKFKREIGLFGGISLVAGMTIGSGIYYLGSYVLERTHMSMGLALICWIIGGIVSILCGLCFAELGASMPVQGGMTTYLSRAYNPAVGFINGFCLFLANGSGSIAALAIACVTVFAGTFAIGEMTVKILAIIIIVLFTALNLRGVKFASLFQNFTMVVRVIPIILIIALGLALGNETPDLSFVPAGSSTGFTFGGMVTIIAYATFASLWAYEGWTNLNTVAEEMKNPRRDLPLSIILSLGFIMIIYTLFNFAIYKVIPANEITDMMKAGNIYFGNEVANRLMGNFGYWIVLIGMVVGILGTVNGDILTFPRTYYAMAKDGYFPKSFAKINPVTGVPSAAILASSAVAIIMVLLRNLEQLTDLVIFTSAALNTLAIFAVLIFRKKYPDMERPYKVWGGPVTVAVTLILFGVLLVNQLITDPMNSLIGLVIPLVGYFVYLYFKKVNGGADYTGKSIE